MAHGSAVVYKVHDHSSCFGYSLDALTISDVSAWPVHIDSVTSILPCSSRISPAVSTRMAPNGVLPEALARLDTSIHFLRK
jgi:hypothetical protein